MSQSKDLGMHLIINEMLRLHAIYMETENGMPKYVYSKDGSLTTEIIGSSQGELQTWFKANTSRNDEFMRTIQDRVMAMRVAKNEEVMQPKIPEATFGIIDDYSQVTEGLLSPGDGVFNGISKFEEAEREANVVVDAIVEFENVGIATHEQLVAYAKRTRPTFVAIPKDTEKLRDMVSKWING